MSSTIDDFVIQRLGATGINLLPFGHRQSSSKGETFQSSQFPYGIIIQMKESYRYAEELYKEVLKNDNA